MGSEPKDKIKWKTKEEIRASLDKEMNLEQFEKELLRLDKLGGEIVQKHRELYPAPKKNDKGEVIENPGNKRYHAAGTSNKCFHCNALVENHDTIMAMQEEYFEITGIPIPNLISAIKVTLGTLRLIGTLKKVDLDENGELKDEQ